MDIITALLCLLGMAGMASPHSTCRSGCKKVQNATWPHLTLSQRNQSIAPWEIREERHNTGRNLLHADCKVCKVTGYDPVEINVTLYLPEPRNPSTTPGHCLCPYQLTVGCTCEPKKQPLRRRRRSHKM